MQQIKQIADLRHKSPTNREELMQVHDARVKYKMLFENCTMSERRYLIHTCESSRDTASNVESLLTELKIKKLDYKSKEIVALEQSINNKAKTVGIIVDVKEKATKADTEQASEESIG